MQIALAPPVLAPGDVVDGRFTIEALAAVGGMGAVFRAIDAVSGHPVAIKVVRSVDDNVRRFALEVRTLSELHHPNIVAYLCHGTLAGRTPFLATEWLEGETLAARLKRAPLDVESTLRVTTQVASALAAAHARGLVHRDLKPSNLFLEGGDVGKVKVIDFGIVRAPGAEDLTVTGVSIGTPGYMAPEQARGERVDARADVYSLGSVLYQCVTGERPFTGDDVMGVLLRVVLEEAPRARYLAPWVPAALDELIARMLSKSPAERPADGGAALDALAAIDVASPPSHVAQPRSLSRTDRPVVCLVLARGTSSSAALDPERDDDEAPTAIDGTADEATPTRALAKTKLARIAAIVGDAGDRLERLADGTLLVTVHGSGTGVDHASRAARHALAIRDGMPDYAVAIVGGRARFEGRVPVGELVDRGVELLAAREPGRVRVDDVVAALLADGFSVRGERGGFLLGAERDAAGPGRTLLGRQTPCVGREREIEFLRRSVAQAAEEHLAKAVLVIARAGLGKSRVRYELVRAIAATREAVVWVARGDPTRHNAPFGMVAPLLQRVAGIAADEPIELRQKRLRARVALSVAGFDVARVTEFLGEVAGVPFAHRESVQLAAARRDPVLMHDQIRRAWEDFVDAECERAPLLIVLEDLQWGDRPSVRLVEGALSRLGDRPLVVIAFARPEVTGEFPELFASASPDVLNLRGLGKRAADRLVREALGPDADDAAVARVVERADGNAFYLEELVRALAEGRDTELPETVLALVEARLSELDPDGRRALRAASIFGPSFPAAGVAALLGAPADAVLRDLSAREIISPDGTYGFRFRNILLREAAYATLTDADRALGHGLAARYLETAGETPPHVMAEHCERGGDRSGAARYYRVSAAAALDADDLAGAVDRAERGLACGPGEEDRVALRWTLDEARLWLGDTGATIDSAVARLAELPLRSDGWYGAAAHALAACTHRGDYGVVPGIVELLLATPREGRGDREHIFACARASIASTFGGRLDDARALLELPEGALDGADPLTQATVHSAHAMLGYMSGDYEQSMASGELAIAAFERAGNARGAALQRSNLGYVRIRLGDYATAEALLRETLPDAARFGLTSLVTSLGINIGLAVAKRGQLDEARALITGALAADPRFVGRFLAAGRIYLGEVLAKQGAHAEAEVELRAAIAGARGTPSTRLHAMVSLARVELETGRAEAALARVREAMAEAGAERDVNDAAAQLLLVEALAATGAREEARTHLAEARRRVRDAASKIGDPRLRATFLEAVEEHRRTLALTV